MKVAVCQQEIIFENKDANVKKICCFSEKAKKMKADIIFFPEMSFTGFSMNINKTAEKDDSNINIIKNAAVKNSLYIGFGWVKPFRDKAENHYSVISSEGGFVYDYVKIHPFSYAGEDKLFIKGNEVKFFDIADIRFSVFVCYDLRFPEIFQVASEKAEVIVIVANWPEKRIEHWKALLRARAIENQCYIIGINCFGRQDNIFYSGESKCYNPDGKLISDVMNGEAINVFDIIDDIEMYRKTFPVKKDRNIELYKNLLQQFQSK